MFPAIVAAFIVAIAGVPIDILASDKPAFKNVKIPVNISVPPVLLVPVISISTENLREN